MKTFMAALSLVAAAQGAIDSDRVASLPGLSGGLLSNLYSGYLTVDASTGRELHYVFAEAETPTNKTVLWLNGGPGCSSLDGWLYENGQYMVDPSDNTKLTTRQYRWTQQANVVWLEAPAGVGFSVDKNGQYATNDNKTADDNARAMAAFFKGFSERATDDFFIAGESYAGVYVPTLAQRILEGNAGGEWSINLKGILVGNGCTGNSVGTCSPMGTYYRTDFLWRKGYISDVLYSAINASCANSWSDPSGECLNLINQASDAVGHVNIYDVIGQCISSGSDAVHRARFETGHLIGGPDACIDAGAATNYLNQDAVLNALNVADKKSEYGRWEICANIPYTSNQPNLPRDVYPYLVKQLRVIIFNGIEDACVPFTDNQDWTTEFAHRNNFAVDKAWHSWVTKEGQVGGYATTYKSPPSVDGSFAFVTVRAAGHMVPQFQPEYASVLLQHFLDGSDF